MSSNHVSDTTNWLKAFRHQIVNLLFGSIAILSTIGLIFAFLQQIQDSGIGLNFVLGYYSVGYIMVLVLYFNRQIPDQWRALSFLVLLYIFSLLALYSGWLAGGGRVFLLPLIVLSTILLGPRAGIMAAIISLLTFAIFGVAFSLNWLSYDLAPGLADPLIIITEGVGYAMAVGMTSIGMWFFGRGLNAANDAIRDAQDARELLAQRALEVDAANQKLEERTRKIEAVNKTLEEQIWFSTGESHLNEAMRGDQEFSVVARRVIQQLCQYLDIQVGALFILEGDTLKLAGRYAYAPELNLTENFNIGEGLVGQVALEKSSLILDEIPPESIKIRSGLGEILPKNLALIPIMYNDQVNGVLELGTLKAFTGKQIEFLHEISGNISLALQNIQARERIQALLSETQNQTAAMQAQEEELRAANEELAAQAEALRAGRVSL